MHPRRIWTLFRKDWLAFLKDKPAVSLTFLVPLVLIYIFGNIFGNSSSNGPSGTVIGIADSSGDPMIGRIVDALDRTDGLRVVRGVTREDEPVAPFTEASLREGIEAGNLRFGLVFHADSIDLEAFAFRVRYLSNPRNAIETNIVEGLLQRTLFTQAPPILLGRFRSELLETSSPDDLAAFNERIAEVVTEFFPVDQAEILASLQTNNPLSPDWAFADALLPPAPEADPSAGEEPGAAPSGAGPAGPSLSEQLSGLVELDREQVIGAEVTNPGVTRSVGGWGLMFLMFSLTGSAISLFDEKKAGLFVRLLSGATTRAELLMSKYLFGLVLGTLQLAVYFAAGWLFFGIDLWDRFVPLMWIALLAAVAATSFGMLIAAISRTTGQANGLATFLILIMSAIGGAWWPVFFMPETIQFFSRLTLVYYAADAFQAILWGNRGLGELWINQLALIFMAVVIMAIAVWRFEKSRLF
ncbi:MAG: ABC transporter permease [Opitutales bacterium]